MFLPLLAVLIVSVASQGRENLLFSLSVTVLDISRLETSYYLFRGAVGEIIILLFPVCDSYCTAISRAWKLELQLEN